MPRLQLESATDTLDLGGISGVGGGLSALTGASGFGLPPVSTQWLAGAGDGAVYRGGRVLPRDIDLPLLAAAADRPGLTALNDRLWTVLAGPAVLRFVEDDGSSWTLDVRHVGGGDLVLGSSTDGRTIANAVVTLRAGDPFWTSSKLSRQEVKASTGRRLLGNLSKLQLSPSQTLGAITMENRGTADASPIWTIYGPGTNFTATRADGQTFTVATTLALGDVRVIDTRAGTLVDGSGANKYDEFGTAPQLWNVPSGTTVAQVALADTTTDSLIVAEWRARKRSII